VSKSIQNAVKEKYGAADQPMLVGFPALYENGFLTRLSFLERHRWPTFQAQNCIGHSTPRHAPHKPHAGTLIRYVMASV
jgi:hypothetical protein